MFAQTPLTMSYTRINVYCKRPVNAKIITALAFENNMSKSDMAESLIEKQLSRMSEEEKNKLIAAYNSLESNARSHPKNNNKDYF